MSVTAINQMREQALVYAARGWHVFPVKPNGKEPFSIPGVTVNGLSDATTDPDLITRMWRDNALANIGIATGPSGLVVVDIDMNPWKQKVGNETWAEHVLEHGHVDTYAARTWSGGVHYFYEDPGGEVRNSQGHPDPAKPTLGRDIDTRGVGGYVVAAPSRVSEDGHTGRYEILKDIPLAHRPQWIVDRLRKPEPRQRTTGAPLAAQDRVLRRLHGLAGELRDAPEGTGNGTAARLAYMAGQYVGAGQVDEDEAIGIFLDAIAGWQHQNPRGAEQMETTIINQVRAGARNPRAWEEPISATPHSIPAVPDPFVTQEPVSAPEEAEGDDGKGVSMWATDNGQGVFLRDRVGDMLYAVGVGWLVWDGRRWEPVEEEFIGNRVSRFYREQFEKMLEKWKAAPGDQKWMEIAKAYRSFMSSGRLKSILNALKITDGVLVSAAALDTHVDLLNTPNGVVDLRTKVLRPHDKKLLFTKITKARYVPGATHPDWDKARTALEADVADYMQLRLGQAITGRTPESDDVVFLMGGGDNGKALKIETPILTTEGWVANGDLTAGMSVFGPDGKPVEILKTHPIAWSNRAYRVTTTDGRTVVANDEHRWTVTEVKKNRQRNVARTMTTQEIVDAGLSIRNDGRFEARFRLPRQEVIESPEVELPLDPYLLGLWLGDGSSSDSTITVGDQDVDHYVEQISCVARIVSQRQAQLPKTEAWTIRFSLDRNDGNGFRALATDMRVLNNKHVPEAYLTAGTGQRLALLQGLMDSDGTVGKNLGQVEFCSIRRELAEAVQYLSRSLGWCATLTTGRAVLGGKDCGEKFRVSFTPYLTDAHLPFRLKRQIANMRPAGTPRPVSIRSAERVENCLMRCITVDSDDGLYLAGRDLMVTHNSSWTSEGVYHVLGDYAALSQPTLVGKQSHGSGPSPERVGLRGVRYALIEELEEGKSLNIAEVKRIIGTPIITARNLNEKEVSFPASHTLFINTNYEPVVAEVDEGTWRRLCRVEFPFRFTLDPQGPLDRMGDAGLKVRIREGKDGQHEAMLAWLVDGAARYYADPESIMRSRRPGPVARATADWRKSADRILAFVEERLEFDPDARIAKSDLLHDFTRFLEDNNHAKWSAETFFSRFGAHHVIRQAGVMQGQVRNVEGLSRPITPGVVFDSRMPVLKSAPRVYRGIRFRID